MAKEKRYTYIPILVTEEKGYTTPRYDIHGRVVISSDSLGNIKPGTSMLYNPRTRKYLPVNEKTAGIDMANKAKDFAAKYQNILHEQQQHQDHITSIYAHSGNHTQINSFADVFSKFIANNLNTAKAHMFDTTFSERQELFKKNTKKIGELGPFAYTPTFNEFAEDTKTLLKDFTIKPFQEDNLVFSGKAQLLLNNSLVNFSETMDYFGLSNLVKGVAYGVKDGDLGLAVDNIKHGYLWDPDKGRKSFYADTGNKWADFGLELISTPANIARLATVGVTKTAGRKVTSDMLRKSAQDVGGNMDAKTANKLAKQVMKHWRTTDSSIVESASRVHGTNFATKMSEVFKAAADGTVDSQKASRAAIEAVQMERSFLKALRNNADIFTQSKTYALMDGVKAVRDGLIAAENMAAKAAITTSPTLLGYYGTLGIVKGLANRRAFAEIYNSITNKFAKNVDPNIIDVEATVTNAAEHFNTASKALGVVDESYVGMGLNNATRRTVSEFAKEMDGILSTKKPSIEILKDLEGGVLSYTGNKETNLLRVLGKLQIDTGEMNINLHPTLEKLKDKYNKVVKSASSQIIGNVHLNLEEVHSDLNKVIKEIKAAPSQDTATVQYYAKDFIDSFRGYYSAQIDSLTSSLGSTKINIIGVKESLEKLRIIFDELNILTEHPEITKLYKEIESLEQAIGSGNLEPATLQQANEVLQQKIDHVYTLEESLANPDDRWNNITVESLEKILNNLSVELDKLDNVLNEFNNYNDYAIEKTTSGVAKEQSKAHLKNHKELIHDLQMMQEPAIHLTGSPVIIEDAGASELDRTFMPDLVSQVVKKDLNNIITKLKGTEYSPRTRYFREYLEGELSYSDIKKLSHIIKNMYREFKEQGKGNRFEITVRDDLRELEDLLDTITFEQPALHIDEAILSTSKLYMQKLPQRFTFELLMSIPELQELFSQVYENKFLGELIELGVRGELDDVYEMHGKAISKAAHDNVITRHILELAENIEDIEVRKAFLDVISGKQTYKNGHYIYDVPAYTHGFVAEMKKYLDSINNTAPPSRDIIGKGIDTQSKVNNLLDELYDDGDKGVLNQRVRKKLFTEETEKMYVDVVYDMSPVTDSMFYELTITDKEGNTTTVVNEPAFLLEPTEELAYKAYYTSRKELKQSSKRLLAKRIADSKEGKVFVAKNNIELANFMRELLIDLSSNALEQGKRVRFIGANNANESRATDRLLNTFLSKAKTGQNIGGVNLPSFSGQFVTADYAQLIRAEDGAWVVTNDLYSTIEKIFKSVSSTTQAVTNSAVEKELVEYTPNLVLDVNTELLQAINAFSSLLDTYIRFPENIPPDTALILEGLSRPSLAAMSSTLHSVVSSMSDTLNAIREANIDHESVLIVGASLAEALGQPNIMPFIDQHDAAIKTVYDPKVIGEWFTGIPSTRKDEAIAAYKIAKSLQYKYNSVRNPRPILQYGREITEVFRKLKQRYLTSFEYNISPVNRKIIEELKPNGPIKDYVSASWLFNRMQSIKAERFTNRQAAAHDAWVDANIDSNVHILLSQGDDIVFTTKPLYTPGISPVPDRFFSNESELIQAGENVRLINEAAADARTLKENLYTTLKLYEAQGIYSTNERASLELLDSYSQWAESIVAPVNEALNKFESSSDDALGKSLAHIEYSKALSKFQKDYEAYRTEHNTLRVDSILNLNAEEYALFLYRESLGVQQFNTLSETLRNSDKWLDFSQTLKEAKKYGVEVYEDSEKHILYAYINRDFQGLAKLTESMHGFTLPNVNPVPVGTPEFMQVHLEYSSGSFPYSMHTAITPNLYEKYIAQLPEKLKPKILTQDHLEAEGLLTGKLNTMVVGDYTDGAFDLFGNHSLNPYTNIASGFNVMLNKAKHKHAYRAMLLNYTNSLHYYTNNLGYNYDSVSRAIRDRIAVLATMRKGRLEKLTVLTDKQYQRYINRKDVYLLDYAAFTKGVEVINDNKVNSKLLGLLQKYIFVPDKIAKLASLGQPVRNIPESILKTVALPGADVTALATIPRSIRELHRYERTLQKLLQDTKGFLTKESVLEFFSKPEVQADKSLLDHDTFSKYQQGFFNTTSAAPTAVQERQTRDIADQLYRVLSDDNRISKKMIRDVLGRYLELNKDFDTLKKETVEHYTKELGSEEGAEVAELITRAMHLVPDWYTKPKVMDKILDGMGNLPTLRLVNYVETVIRFHAFTWSTEYTGASASEAIGFVDAGQKNRARDTKAQRLVEVAFPFSSFAFHNLVFWAESANRYNSILGLLNSVYKGMTDEDELDIEEISRNYSLQYNLLNGNIILDDTTGLTLKTNDAVYSALEFMVSPLKTLFDMFQDQAKSVLYLTGILDYDIPFAEEGTPEYAEQRELAKRDAIIQAIPVVNVLYTKYNTIKKYRTYTDSVVLLALHSIFGFTKMDSAGTTYESRPIGYDWYNQSDEYRRTHKYVFGVSYIPSWMTKDPTTYVDTYGRLLKMGYSKEEAQGMMEDGWHIRRADYQLDNWQWKDGVAWELRNNDELFYGTLLELTERGYSNDKAVEYIKELFPDPKNVLQMDEWWKYKYNIDKNITDNDDVFVKLMLELSRQGYSREEAMAKLREMYPYAKGGRGGGRSYPKKTYHKKTYAARAYPTRIRDSYSHPIHTVDPRRKNSTMYPAAYRNIKYFGQRDLYKDNYARYGAPRMAMRLYSGANASAIKLARETMKERQRKSFRRFF